MPPLMPPINSPRSFVKPKSHTIRNLSIVIGVLVIVLVGFFMLKGNAPKKASNPSHKTYSATNVPISSTTKHYVSKEQILNIAFDYPSNWTVSPASTTYNGSSNITVKSPVMPIVDANGKTLPGQIVINFRPGGAQINELVQYSAAAAANSVQIAYSNPSPNQLVYPYITFVNLSSNPNPNGLFQEVIITGPDTFNMGAPVTSASLSGLDTIISATFYDCSLNDCSTDNNTLSINSNIWQNSALFNQVLKVFESISLP